MLYLATDHGVVCAQREDDWRVTGRGLEAHSVTALVARPGLALAGTRAGIFRSEDDGRSWQAVEAGPGIAHVRWLAWRAGSPGALAGTEPAGIFYSDDSGQHWQDCPEVQALRDRFGWSLPYSPEAGCVRGFALHGPRAYAAVEVGGVLVSGDGGQTWRLAGGSDGRPSFNHPSAARVHPDVHSILVHPSSPERVYAPTGGGFYRSEDGGDTWRFLYDAYCRAAWVDPADPDHIILGPARSVDRGGRIEVTRDGGASWQAASHGLQVPWPETMVERFVPVADELLAVLSNGTLLSAALGDLSWRQILPEAARVNAAAVDER